MDSGFAPSARPGMRAESLLACRRLLFSDRALKIAHLGRQLIVLGAQQEGVEAAAVVDRLQRIGRDPQLDRAPERVGDHGDIEQIGQEPALGLAVRVAHLIADQGSLAGQFAAA